MTWLQTFRALLRPGDVPIALGVIVLLTGVFGFGLRASVVERSESDRRWDACVRACNGDAVRLSQVGCMCLVAPRELAACGVR